MAVDPVSYPGSYAQVPVARDIPFNLEVEGAPEQHRALGVGVGGVVLPGIVVEKDIAAPKCEPETAGVWVNLALPPAGTVTVEVE